MPEREEGVEGGREGGSEVEIDPLVLEKGGRQQNKSSPISFSGGLMA